MTVKQSSLLAATLEYSLEQYRDIFFTNYSTIFNDDEITKLLKCLKVSFINAVLQGEMTLFLGYTSYDITARHNEKIKENPALKHVEGTRIKTDTNLRNGKYKKIIKLGNERLSISFPRDRHGLFKSKFIEPYKHDAGFQINFNLIDLYFRRAVQVKLLDELDILFNGAYGREDLYKISILVIKDIARWTQKEHAMKLLNEEKRLETAALEKERRKANKKSQAAEQ